MNIQKNIPLAPLTTLGVGGPAKYFVEIEKNEDMVEALAFARKNNLDIFVLGGGSNMVVSDNGFDGLVVSINNKGIKIVEETDDSVFVKVASGEIWDNVVKCAVEREWWGIENLSYIPGKMGGFAVQNVGAYGVEASEVVDSVVVYDFSDEETKTLTNDECGFAYRRSMFNSTDRGRYVILETILKLSKTPHVNADYVDVKNYFKEHEITDPTIQQIRNAIIDIRKRKFADPKHIGTAGSFFKNLYVSQDEYMKLRERILDKYGQEKVDTLDDLKNKFSKGDTVTVVTGFLMDKVFNLKGMSIGGAQVSPTQVLAIINPEKKATSVDIMSLIKKLRVIFYENTGIELGVEPELVGFTKEELDNYLAL